MSIPTSVRQLLAQRPLTVALIGATETPHKYGSIILRDLVAKGIDVAPVNPGRSEVHGRRCFATVAEVDRPVDLVNVVVPPTTASTVVSNAAGCGCGLIWFQPGAFDTETVRAAEAVFDTVIAGPCIMVETR